MKNRGQNDFLAIKKTTGAIVLSVGLTSVACQPSTEAPKIKRSGGAEADANSQTADTVNFGPQGAPQAGGDGQLQQLSERPPRTCKQAEDRDQLVSYQHKFTIPARTKGCAYNQNGNLATQRITYLADGTRETARAQGYVRARSNHTEVIELPSKLCETSIDINQANFEYQDNLVIALNNKVLMSTAGQIVARLPQKTTKTIEGEQPLRLWSWFNAADTRVEEDDPRPYCVFYGNQNCEAPGPNGSGGGFLFGFGNNNNNNGSNAPLRLQMSEEELTDLITDRRHKRSVRFSLIALGDEDSDDCTHSAVDVTIDFKLMPESANDEEDDNDQENKNEG